MLHYQAVKSFRQLVLRPYVVSAAVALAGCLALYGGTVRLPLFSDDLGQIPWLEQASWFRIWSSAGPYNDYRPLWYSIWQVWRCVTGGLVPKDLHALNLATHVAAASLTGLLAATWSSPEHGRGRRSLSAVVGTVLFSVFPYSGQAVAWPSALPYPLVTTMAVGAALAYDCAGRRASVTWAVVAAALSSLAPFAYESGLLVGPLLLVAEGIGRRQGRYSPGTWRPGVLFCTWFAAVSVWWALSGSQPIPHGLAVPDIARNVAFLLQGLVFPAAPLARFVAGLTGSGPVVAVVAVAAATLVFLVKITQKPDRQVLLLGMSWFTLLALPSVASLRADWFEQAPRLLYVPAVGASLLWTSAIVSVQERLASGPRTPPLAAALAAILVLGVAISVGFVRRGVQLYGMAGECIWEVARAPVGDRPSLFVNLPSRVEAKPRTYALGFEGVAPLPARVDAAQIVYAHTGVAHAATNVAFGAAGLEKPAGYSYEPLGRLVTWDELASEIREASFVYRAHYEESRIRLVPAGFVSESSEVEDSGTKVRFRDEVVLLDVHATCAGPGQVTVNSTWRAEKRVEADVTLFVHLVSEDGQMVAQADGYPLDGMLPLWLWRPSEIVHDVREFSDAPHGECTVRLGLWDRQTGERWNANGTGGDIIQVPVRCLQHRVG